MEGGSGTPDTTIEPSGGVVGLIQRNTDEGRCLLENPSEMLTKSALLMMLYPAAQVLWLGSHVVVFSTCGLQTAPVLYCEGGPLQIPGTTCLSCALLLYVSMVSQLLY